jgi:transcription initiation factor TFIID TATA-box-binding protein
VATVNLNIEGPLPLDIIANKCNNTQYNKKRFPAVIMRKKNPKTTGLIFGTGKMIVIGAKSVE